MNRIFKNSIYSVVRVIITVPIFFILVPYILSKIGEDGSGLWALIGVVASYQIFIDFGLTSALVRYVAKENILKNYEAISEYLVTSLIIYLVLGVIIYFFIVLFRNFILLEIFAIKFDYEKAMFLFLVSGFCAILNMIAGLFKSVIEGVQRIDVMNVVIMAQIIISAFGTIFFLEKGYGLVGLGYNLILTSILSLILNIYYSRKVLPYYKLNPALFRISRFKEMFAYSINIQLAGLSRVWIDPLNKIIISNYYSVSYVFFL